jgi:hypothetical protein
MDQILQIMSIYKSGFANPWCKTLDLIITHLFTFNDSFIHTALTCHLVSFSSLYKIPFSISYRVNLLSNCLIFCHSVKVLISSSCLKGSIVTFRIIISQFSCSFVFSFYFSTLNLSTIAFWLPNI